MVLRNCGRVGRRRFFLLHTSKARLNIDGLLWFIPPQRRFSSSYTARYFYLLLGMAKKLCDFLPSCLWLDFDAILLLFRQLTPLCSMQLWLRVRSVTDAELDLFPVSCVNFSCMSLLP